jgi:hypothetical protein
MVTVTFGTRPFADRPTSVPLPAEVEPKGMTGYDGYSPWACCRCGSSRTLMIRTAGGSQYACLQVRGPCGFWWERSDGVRLFQRTRMLLDGREHPRLSPEAIGRVGRVLEVVRPPRT